MTAQGHETGLMIDGWRIVEKLGKGSYGQVFRVEKGGLFFALKLLARQAADPAEQSRVEGRSRRELECLLALRHPNIARLWSHGRWPHPTEGQVYLVLDYVEGFTVAQWKERCAPTPHQAVVLFATLAQALAYMHKRGVKHRDIKPANIMVGRQDRQPVLVDYGAADRTGSETVTDERLPPGTPRYTSPQATRFDWEHRKEPHARYEYQIADEIYAFGVTLYDVLTVARLDSAPEYLPVSSEVLEPQRAHLVNPRVPVALSELVAELISRDPARRPVDFEVVYRKLMELAPLQGGEWHGQPIDPPPPPAIPPVPESVAAPSRGQGREGPPRLGQFMAFPWRSRKLGWRAAAGGALALGVVLGVGHFLVLARRSAGPQPGGAARESSPPTEVRAETPSVPERGAEVPLKPPPPVPPAPSKRGPPMKKVKKEVAVESSAQPLCSQEQPPPADQPMQLRQWCQCAGIAIAFASACTGPQVRPIRPPPGECPEEALATMKSLGLDLSQVSDDKFGVTLDSSRPEEGMLIFKNGPITSVVTNSKKLPIGTLLFGEVWAGPFPDPRWPASDPRAEGWHWVIRYNRMQLPGKRAVPVCMATAPYWGAIEYQDSPGSQPGAPRWNNRGEVVYPLPRWG